jgi:uncharacterized protein (TIGR03435 family)
MTVRSASIVALATGILATAVQVGVGHAQSAERAFEVVSIKRNTSNPPGASIGIRPGGQFVMVNMEIRALIGSAYPTDTSEYIGAPDWVLTERYDITAKAPENTASEDMQPMFQALLAERFEFKGHYETREQPIYELVLARADGRLGPELKKLEVDCAARRAARLRGDAPPELPARPNGVQPCGMRAGGGQIVSGGMPMANFVRSIQGGTGRVIVDKTGLTGDYEFTLTYTSNPGPDSDRPSIFTALQEQLGLKLESARGPVRVFVIDHIERPTED